YFEERIRPLNDAFRAIAAKHRDVSIILPAATMCRDDGCMTTLGNQFLYRDVGHIRRNLPMPTREAFAGMLGIDDIAKRYSGRDFGSIPATQWGGRIRPCASAAPPWRVKNDFMARHFAAERR